MKRIKKLAVIALATVMLLGATMTVSAAPATPTCKNCGHTGSVTLVSTDHCGIHYHHYNWWCQYCGNHFTTYPS